MVEDDLPCNELVELVNDYLDGTLPSDERARFDAHLQACPGCRNYLDQMRTTIGLAGRLRIGDLSPLARAELISAFKGYRSSSPG